jgi:hypothetical protein
MNKNVKPLLTNCIETNGKENEELELSEKLC